MIFPKSSIFSLKPCNKKFKIISGDNKEIASTDLADLFERLLSPDVPHRILEPRQSNPEPVEALVRPVDCEDGGAGVGLGHPSVPLEDHNLGPDLIINAVPLVENLLEVILTIINNIITQI